MLIFAPVIKCATAKPHHIKCKHCEFSRPRRGNRKLLQSGRIITKRNENGLHNLHNVHSAYLRSTSEPSAFATAERATTITTTVCERGCLRCASAKKKTRKRKKINKEKKNLRGVVISAHLKIKIQ